MTSRISWGRRDKITFSSHGALRDWAPPVTPALFAVTYQRDPSNKPKGHTVFYFGESENSGMHAGSLKRKISEMWSQDGGNPEDLFVFVHELESAHVPLRARLVENLILEYQPQGNKMSVE